MARNIDWDNSQNTSLRASYSQYPRHMGSSNNPWDNCKLEHLDRDRLEGRLVLRPQPP